MLLSSYTREATMEEQKLSSYDNSVFVKEELSLEINPTVIYSNLQFGDQDGIDSDGLLQHPLGIMCGNDGEIYITDRHNHKVDNSHPGTERLCTKGNKDAQGEGEGEVVPLDLQVRWSKRVVVESSSGAREFIKWTEDMDARLLHAMLEESRLGNKVDGSWTTQAYNNIVDNVHTCEYVAISKNNVKNRQKVLKDKWRELFSLINLKIGKTSWMKIEDPRRSERAY
ncbi:Protein SUPPRESSOR OF QUENCHING 1 [Vigna angularis]|uniref:Protein SUPPRESSOR OF QUENCHING 1 n=1 Tax=Phaseolus angularis TaxID=3914 RepID=A0A8T0KI90_PHAAN|nr:Protein SUPPRESSOR OF QUENCHING 1 [Vigna angularis]